LVLISGAFSFDLLGQTPGGGMADAMLAAIRDGRLDLVQAGIREGMDPNLRNTYGTSLLMQAAASGKVEIARFLLANGATPKATGNEAIVAEAALYNHIEIVRMLVEAGAPLNAPRTEKNRKDVLVEAVRHDNLEMFKYLLDHGANPKGVGLFEDTALQMASSKGNLEMMRLLLSHGADVNQVDQNGWTALMRACRSGKKEAVVLLLANGADPAMKDKGGKTAAMFAQCEHHEEIEAICAGKP